MEKTKVFIGTIENVIHFVNITEELEARVYFVDESNFINANALLAVFSLNLKKIWGLEIFGNKSECVIAKKALKDFIME